MKKLSILLLIAGLQYICNVESISLDDAKAQGETIVKGFSKLEKYKLDELSFLKKISYGLSGVLASLRNKDNEKAESGINDISERIDSFIKRSLNENPEFKELFEILNGLKDKDEKEEYWYYLYDIMDEDFI